jgi:hypothetical protein
MIDMNECTNSGMDCPSPLFLAWCVFVHYYHFRPLRLHAQRCSEGPTRLELRKLERGSSAYEQQAL